MLRGNQRKDALGVNFEWGILSEETHERILVERWVVYLVFNPFSFLWDLFR